METEALGRAEPELRQRFYNGQPALNSGAKPGEILCIGQPKKRIKSYRKSGQGRLWESSSVATGGRLDFRLI